VIEKLPTWILPTKKTGMQWLLEALDVFKRMLGEVREADRHGAAPDCYGLDIIRSQAEPNGLSDDEAAFVCGSSFSAGSNALTSALLVAMMAFVLFPEAADKARHEIDCLVGSDRLPTHEDLMSLPYTASFIKEVPTPHGRPDPES
jgi:cytochrome P450